MKTRLLFTLVTWLGFWVPLGVTADEDFTPAYGDGIHSDLQTASWLGDREIVVELLEAGALVDQVDAENGATPLMFAAAAGDLVVMETLLSYGADLNALSAHGAPPISYAIEFEEHNAAALLLAAGVDVNSSWFGNTTPLLAACYRGDVAMMSIFIDAGADLSTRYTSGVCALSAAAASGNPGAVGMLLELGLEVETVNVHGSSPLMFAAINGHPEVIQVLLDAGAAVDAARQNGDTPLLRAAGAGCRECVEILLGAGAEVDACSANGANVVMHAAWHGHEDLLEVLAAHGADIHAADERGATALAYAATQGHAGAVAKLLEIGSEIDRPDSDGMTPLMRAAKADHEACVIELLDLGADFDVRTKNDLNAFDIAITNGSDASVQAMFRAGILDHASQERLDQLLQQSIEGRCSRETVSLILELGADPNCRGANERTPLHIAASEANVEAIELLLEVGADVYARDGRGMVPIFLTGMPGQRTELDRSISLLVHAGPDFVDRASGDHLQAWFRNVATRMSVDSFRELVELSGCLTRLEETTLRRHINLVGATGDIERLAVIGVNLEFEHTAPWILGAAVRYATRAVERGYEVDDLELLPDYSEFTIAWPKGRTPLHRADITTHEIDFAMALGINPNAEDDRGNRPLYWLLIGRDAGSVTALQRLLEAGADPNRLGTRSIAIDQTIRNGHVETLKILLEAGADPAVCLHSNRDQTIVSRIVQATRHEGMLELLVSAGLDPNGGDKNRPALHSLVQTTSARAGQMRRTTQTGAMQHAKSELDIGLAGIERLIAAGFDIESRDSYGRTPLMLATEFDVFSVLIDSGADIKAVNDEGKGVLECAVQARTPYDPRVLVFLCQQEGLWDLAVSRGINPLAGVISTGDLEAFEQVLAVAPDIEVVDERGQTALFAAVRQYTAALVYRYHTPPQEFDEERLSAAIKMVERLLESGASVRAKDKSGQTLLHGMVDIPVVRLLVEHGCDVNDRDAAMQTPLLAAARRRDAVSLRALLDFGADPLMSDANGRLAIDYLAEPTDAGMHGGSEDVVETYRRVYWRLKEASSR